MAFGKLQIANYGNALQFAGLDPTKIKPLIDEESNCTQALEHNGPVTIDYQHKPNQSRNFAPLHVKTAPGYNAELIDGDLTLNGDLYLNGSLSGNFSRSFRFQNLSGEVIPPYACMTMVSPAGPGNDDGATLVNGQYVFKMYKPSTRYDRFYYLNGPSPVPIDGYGWCNGGDHAEALVDASGGPDTGNPRGPLPDTWLLWSNSIGGFTTLSPHRLVGTDKVALVRQSEVTQSMGLLQADMSGSVVDVNVKLYTVTGQDTGFVVAARTQLLASPATTVPSGTLVYLFRQNNAWYVTSWVTKMPYAPNSDERWLLKVASAGTVLTWEKEPVPDPTTLGDGYYNLNVLATVPSWTVDTQP